MVQAVKILASASEEYNIVFSPLKTRTRISSPGAANCILLSYFVSISFRWEASCKLIFDVYLDRSLSCKNAENLIESFCQ